MFFLPDVVFALFPSQSWPLLVPPELQHADFVGISDQIGVGSHKVSWPRIVWAVVSQSCPFQARLYPFRMFVAICFAMTLTGMDQLSQRDQMQVMQALNEMQMQEGMESLFFVLGKFSWKLLDIFISLYMSSFRNTWTIMQVVSGCFGLLPQVLPYRALTGDDEYLQQPGREVLQRMCHKLSHQGELERAKRQSFLSLTASGQKNLCQCFVGLLMDLRMCSLFTLLNLKPFPPCNLQQFSAKTPSW